MKRKPASRPKPGAAGPAARACADALRAIGRGDLEGARRSYEEALRLGTSDPDAYNNLAVLAHRRGDLEATLRYLTEGVARAPGAPSLRENLVKALRGAGHAALGAGRWAQAIALYERTLAAAGDDAESELCLAHALLRAGRRGDAPRAPGGRGRARAATPSPPRRRR